MRENESSEPPRRSPANLSGRVFEGLRVTQTDYTGHVVFLEEDHYAAPDILHVLDLMKRLKPSLCPACQVLALGNYNKLNPGIYKNYVSQGAGLSDLVCPSLFRYLLNISSWVIFFR